MLNVELRLRNYYITMVYHPHESCSEFLFVLVSGSATSRGDVLPFILPMELNYMEAHGRCWENRAGE